MSYNIVLNIIFVYFHFQFLCLKWCPFCQRSYVEIPKWPNWASREEKLYFNILPSSMSNRDQKKKYWSNWNQLTHAEVFLLNVRKNSTLIQVTMVRLRIFAKLPAEGPFRTAQILSIRPIFNASNQYSTLNLFRSILDASFSC
jgi:hypothetical protein